MSSGNPSAQQLFTYVRGIYYLFIQRWVSLALKIPTNPPLLRGESDIASSPPFSKVGQGGILPQITES